MNDDHGKYAEDDVEKVFQELIGDDFVLRSPQLIEPSGPKELTDVLGLIDNTVIIIQSKSLIIDISDLDDTKFNRIRRKQERARDQINTTLNAQDRNALVRAKTSLGVTFDVDWDLIRKKVGIITLNLPDDRYNDPEFRFQYPYLIEQHRGIMVHTFILRDLIQMTVELTTPGDFFLYLRARERCLVGEKFLLGNELDFLGLFKTRFPMIKKALSDPVQRIFIVPGLWEEYRKDHRKQIEKRNKRFKKSGMIDGLIRQLRSSIEFTAEQQGIDYKKSCMQYLLLIGKLGKLPRIERAFIGDKIWTKVEKTQSEKLGYFVYQSKFTDTAYVFLLFNGENREERQNLLEHLCIEACHIVSCAGLVGVATGGGKQPKSSTDALFMDVNETKRTTNPDPNYNWFAPKNQSTENEWGS